jgi:iron(III) transport system substrate-binding protein
VRRLFSWVAGLLVLTVFSIPAIAQETPVLTIYSGRGEALVGPIIQQFSQATGIEVEVLYGNTAAVANQIIEEGANSPADVYYGQDAGALGALAKAKLLTALPAEITDLVTPEFRSSEGLWVGTSGRARVLVYNPTLVEELGLTLPQSILDLTQPEYEGLVGWAPENASLQAQVTALRVLLGDEAAETWLAGMVANGAVSFGSSNTNLYLAVGSGEIPLGISNHYYMFGILASNPDLSLAQHIFPDGDPGALVNIAGVGVLANPDQPELAQQFVEFLLSPIAQQYFATETYEYPVIDGIITHPLLLPLASIETPEIDLSNLDDLQATVEMIESSGALD